MFRTTFYHNAALLLSALMRCGVQCLDDFLSEVRGKVLRGGSIVVLYTHGRNGHYHPHLHLIATSGGFDSPGQRWEHVHYPTLSRCKKRKNLLPSAEYSAGLLHAIQGRYTDGISPCRTFGSLGIACFYHQRLRPDEHD